MGNDHCGVLELPTMLIDYSMDNIIEGSGFLLVFHLQYAINFIWVIINGWWFQTWLLFSISYIWDVILPIDELIFFKMVIAPPTRLYIYI